MVDKNVCQLITIYKENPVYVSYFISENLKNCLPGFSDKQNFFKLLLRLFLSSCFKAVDLLELNTKESW